MDIDHLRARFPDENACRTFFESIYGEVDEFVRIAIVQSPIDSQAKVQGLGYMSVTSASGNLP